jgi:8-oxo-dGTP pyrophosphatase MutT (NUDIX family)
MESKEEIVGLVDTYLEDFPNEKERVSQLVRFLDEHTEDALIDRKNFRGHITTSAFILNENAASILLLQHKSLNRWLQPGGHVDRTDTSLKAAALREAIEETGLITGNLELLSPNIFDVDSHHIPENTRKQEPAHVHHDIRFLFKCANSQSVNISEEESTDSKWIPFVQLQDNQDFYWLEEKVRLFS